MQTPSRPKKQLDQVHDTVRRRHYWPRTEESDIHWINRFVFFHDKRHPNEMGASEKEQP
jgi:hypothetical protein